MTSKWLFAAWITVVVLWGLQAVAADKENCLMCHKHRFNGRIDENGKRWNYYVDELAYRQSVHRIVSCRDCHTNITKIPHDPVNRAVDCSNQCHIKPPFAQQNFTHQKLIDLFNTSAHGYGMEDSEAVRDAKPHCKFCHLNPLYTSISEESITSGKMLARCYNCHQDSGVVQAYKHITHRLRRRTSRSSREIVSLCSKCHNDERRMRTAGLSGKALEVVQSYSRSIHGKLVRLGSHQAADCISCHASDALHDIYSKDFERATISKDNLARTCSQCHQQVNDWFVRIGVHPEKRSEPSRLVRLAGVILKFAVYGTVFSMFGVLLLEAYRRRREGIGLTLKNSTSWHPQSRRRTKTPQGATVGPQAIHSRNHSPLSYALGLLCGMLALLVLTGTLHQFTLSDYGPGLLKPLWGLDQEERRSPILDEARRQADFEKHRHFHNPTGKYPRLPANKRPVCFVCHSELPHKKNKRIRGLMNIHTQFFVCETCHIREKPGMKAVYKWYNPLDNNPEGPFYGTSYNPETGTLAAGKDQIARIAPFFRTPQTAILSPAVLVQDAPLARDYMNVRDQLSAEQREGIKNKFHASIKPRGHQCQSCHGEKSRLDFKQLGFTPGRIDNLKKLDIVGMLSKYDEFYMPELFGDRALP